MHILLAYALFLRAFKDEKVIEAWVQRTGGEYHLEQTFAVCALSGGPGPKLREGDGQVPEGFYRIDLFNPHSQFHLSMRVSYPNEYDRRRHRTGGEIFIHGNCVSIGCLAITDAGIDQLWKLARGAQGAIPVHIFPSRKPADPELREGLELFEKRHIPPRVRVSKDGRYVFE